MTEDFNPGGQLLFLALIFFYWQLLCIWLQPPPSDGKDDGRREQPPTGTSPGLAALAFRTPAISAGAALESEPAVAAKIATLAELRAVDPGFDESAFLAGAARAYEAIVNAYAQEDIGVLELLLDLRAYTDFKDAIAARRKRGERFAFTFIGHRSIEITEVRSDADVAEITVRFTTEAVAATYGSDGSLVNGMPDRVVEIMDTWTFARRVASRDPDWKLVAT